MAAPRRGPPIGTVPGAGRTHHEDRRLQSGDGETTAEATSGLDDPLDLGESLDLGTQVVVVLILVLLAELACRGLRWLSRSEPGMRPSPRLDAMVLAAALVGFGLGSLAVQPFAGGAEPPSFQQTLRLTVAIFAVTALAVLLALRVRGGGGADVGLYPIRGRPLLLAFPTWLTLVPAMLAVTLVEAMVRHWLGLPDAPQQTVVGLADRPELLADPVVVGTITVAVPLCEELVFRGVLLTVLWKITRHRWAAIVLSAAGFALLHDAGRIPVCVLGIGMGWLYTRTGSLWAPFLVHALHNGSTLVLLRSTLE